MILCIREDSSSLHVATQTYFHPQPERQIMIESNLNAQRSNRGIGAAEQACQTTAGASNGCAVSSPERTVTVTVDVRAARGFGDALYAALDGQRITRAGWNAPGQWVAAQYTDKGSMMSRPYLYLKNAQNDLVPWVPSQGDLFAHDWAVLPR